MEYSLKLASRPLQRTCLLFLLLFLAAMAAALPWQDFPRTVYLSQAAIHGVSGLLIANLALVAVFAFYRNQVQVSLDETGLQLPGHGFIAWQSIQWYRIDRFTSNIGVRRVILKTDAGKAVLLAEDDASLSALTAALRQQLRLHNPQARDFRELPSSRIRAAILISIFSAIHLVICLQTGFDQKYVWIFTPALLIGSVAILVEHIKFGGAEKEN